MQSRHLTVVIGAKREVAGRAAGLQPDNLVFMKRTADRLFGDDYPWSVLGAGAAQIPLATTAVRLGGNVRVGREDSLFITRGVRGLHEASTLGARNVHGRCR